MTTADKPPLVLEGALSDGTAAAVTIEAGRISRIQKSTVDTGRRILPGFIDLQVNGYLGFDVNADDVSTDTIIGLTHALWLAGTSAYCPTIVSASEEKIMLALQTIREACESDRLVGRSIVGIHVEGPYLSCEDGPRGAHDAAHLRAPDSKEFASWQRAAGGRIAIVTLAPELPHAISFIRGITAAGVIASIGHSSATAHDVHQAADAGASMSTHLGNGASAVLPRHPNHIWAQLADQRLSAGFIADGHHLPADTFTSMVRAKGIENSFLVSDTVALAGFKPGDYETPVGGTVTVAADGSLRLADTGFLAGSGTTLVESFVWASMHSPFAVKDLARMVSGTPARLLGLGQRGAIAIGAAADLTIIEDATMNTTVVIDGIADP